MWERPDVRDALAATDWGAVFRIVRRCTGMTQTRLGAVVDLPQSRVSAIESGSHHVEKLDVVLRIAETLGMTSSARRIVGLADLASDSDGHGQYDLDQGFATAMSWEDDIDVTRALWKDDMERRKFLLDAAFTAQTSSAAAFYWIANSDRGPVDVSKPGRRRVGESDVESVRRITEAFRSNESRFGGGRARSTFVYFLTEDVAPLLREGSYSGKTARNLFSAVAEAELLGGWMAYDSEHHGLAQQYFVAALRLAHDASDVALAGEILNAMSHQALHLARPREAVNLSRTAQEAARGSGVGALLSESCLLEANGHAVLGEERACSTAMHRAERALERADRSEEPHWIAFFDDAYLSARSAHCMRDLGRLPRAEQLARQSLDMDPHYTRGMSFNLALLASIKARKGDVEAACGTGLDAIALMNTLHSKRSHRYIHDLNKALRPYGAAAVTEAYARAARGILAGASL